MGSSQRKTEQGPDKIKQHKPFIVRIFDKMMYVAVTLGLSKSPNNI